MCPFFSDKLAVKKKSFVSSYNKVLCWHKQFQSFLECSVECPVHVELFNHCCLHPMGGVVLWTANLMKPGFQCLSPIFSFFMLTDKWWFCKSFSVKDLIVSIPICMPIFLIPLFEKYLPIFLYSFVYLLKIVLEHKNFSRKQKLHVLYL